MNHLLKLVVALALIGCGAKYPTGDQNSTNLALTNSDAIIDGLDWTALADLNTNSSVYKNGLKFGQITITKSDGDYLCTAFSIGKNQIMTNNHCVGTASTASKVSFEISGETYDCTEFVLGNASLDYTVLKCKGELEKKHGKVSLSTASIPVLGQAAYTIHDNCNYLVDESCEAEVLVSPGVIYKTIFGNIKHNCDTLQGSSGGAVFDFATHKVVALHNLGIGSQADGWYNKAVEMKKIVLDIYWRKSSILK